MSMLQTSLEADDGPGRLIKPSVDSGSFMLSTTFDFSAAVIFSRNSIIAVAVISLKDLELV